MSFTIKKPRLLRERKRRSLVFYSSKKKKIKIKNEKPIFKKSLKESVTLKSSKTCKPKPKLIIQKKEKANIKLSPSDLCASKDSSRKQQFRRKLCQLRVELKKNLSSVKVPFSKKDLRGKGTWSTSRDKKLCNISIIFINSDCRNKAEIAMKLRKGLPKKVDKGKTVSSDSDTEVESSIEDSHSESDVDSDEDVFDYTKSYTLRKKSTASDKRRSGTRPGSASDSSSESLLDIPPTCGSYQKWSYSTPTTTSKDKDNKPPATAIPKSPKRSEEKTQPTKSVECARALRSSSSDGVTVTQGSDLLNLRHSIANKASKHIAKSSVTYPSSSTSKSPRRSPDRLRNEKPTPSTSACGPTKGVTSSSSSIDKPELEKSYSLRHLESKGTFSSTSLADKPTKKLGASTVSTFSKTVPVNVNVTIPPRKKPGRPRKDASATPPVIPNTDLPLAKRTRRTTSNELISNLPIPPPPTQVQKKCIEQPEATSSPLQRRLHDPTKQQRDAIALRARQSKIMAKSRVLQSNKYSFNASWRKPISDKMDKDEITTSSPPGQSAFDKTKSRSSPTLASEEDQSSSSSTGSASEQSGSGSSSSTNTTQPSPDIGSLKSSNKPKSSPVAKCEICELTFTRKFSFTKHLATRQHQNSMRKQHQRMLRKCGTKETRQIKPRNEDHQFKGRGRGETTGNDSMLDSSCSPLEEIEGEENENENLENEEEEEEEEIKCPEWLSGRAVGVNNYVCDVCGDIFIKRFDFSAHLWNHRAGSDLVCSECGLKFAESDKFNEHIDVAHVVDIKFSCKICPSKFNREDYLVKHMESHKQDSNEKFICSVCDKRFSAHELLSRHFDIKHLQLGKPKVELFCDDDTDIFSFPSHILYVRQSLALQAGGIDNNFENHDPNDPNAEEEDENYEECEEKSEPDETPIVDTVSKRSIGNYQSSSRLNSSIRSYLQKSWLNDNSIIGCGVTSERVPPFKYNPLSCKDCGKLFESRKLLVHHVEEVTESERYVCQVCKKVFKWRYLLNRHMTHFHTRGKEQLKLNKQKISKMKPNFLKYRQMPSASANPANANLKALPKLLPIQSHSQVISSSARVKSLCSSPLPTKVAVHNIKSPQVDVIARLPLTKTINPSYSAVKKPSMKMTSNVSPTPKPMLSSKPKHKSIAKSIDPLGPSISGSAGDREIASSSASAPVNRKSTFEPSAGQGNTFFTCDLCSKSFTDKNTLTVHTWYHQSASLLSCPNCDAKCERKSDFELHYKCHETNQPFFLCYVCFKPFRWKKDMIRHVRKKHPDEKTYRCLYCSERFRVNEELCNHISESHAKHRSFPCDYCGKRYAQKRYLLLHIRTQHGIDGSEIEISPDQLLVVEEMVEGEGDVVTDEPELELDIDIPSFTGKLVKMKHQ